MTAAELRPVFERALQGYVQEQEGMMCVISVKSVLAYMKKNGKRFQLFETEDDDKHMAKMLNQYFREFFGATWDGIKYRDNGSLGKKLFIGSDNLLDLIRYNGATG